MSTELATDVWLDLLSICYRYILPCLGIARWHTQAAPFPLSLITTVCEIGWAVSK